MLVRSATLEDIAALMALERQATSAAHWSRDQYDRALAAVEPRRKVLVIEDNSPPLGFLVARSVGAEWEIENIAVAEPARHRGLGTRLMREFLDQARSQGAEAVFLEVRESNRAARALYEKWSFAESGRRALYYREPAEDAVVYRLSLA